MSPARSGTDKVVSPAISGNNLRLRFNAVSSYVLKKGGYTGAESFWTFGDWHCRKTESIVWSIWTVE